MHRQEVIAYFEHRDQSLALVDEKCTALDTLLTMDSDFVKTRDYLERLIAELTLTYTMIQSMGKKTPLQIEQNPLYVRFQDTIQQAIDTIPNRPRTEDDTRAILQLASSVKIMNDKDIQQIQKQFISLVKGEDLELSFRLRVIMQFLIPCLIGFGLYQEFHKIHIKRLEIWHWYSNVTGLPMRSNRIKRNYDRICLLEKDVASLFLCVLQCPQLVECN
jgi:hypothetical protein